MLAKAFPLAPLRDALTGQAPAGFELEPSFWHLATTPFSSFADSILCNGVRQDIVLFAYLLAGFWIYRLAFGLKIPTARALKQYAGYLLLVFLYLGWAVLGPRPAARLVAKDPNALLLDFHSHTNASWDGRKSFSAEANARWHERFGFGASFITDHNAAPATAAGTPLCRLLAGEELSLDKAHVVALGARERIDPAAYGGEQGLRRFLAEAWPKHRALAVLSLPEYWRHRWDSVPELADAGAAGLELVNASPKALEFPPSKSREVIELARRKNLFLVGAGDNHGWASSPCVWNAMTIPGHARMDASRLALAVIEGLRKERFSAVTVIERVRMVPESTLGLALSPITSAWTLLRTFSWAQTAVSLLWLSVAFAYAVLALNNP